MKLNRRTLLQGLGGLTALPWLEALHPARAFGQSAPTPPKRFIVFYTPGGTVMPNWRPTGDQANYSFGQILQPLTPHKQNVTVLDGLKLQVCEDPAAIGHPHTRGMGALLTGDVLNAGNYVTNGGNVGFAKRASLDQVIANKLFDAKVNKRRSLEMAVRWPTNLWNGPSCAPDNQLIYEGNNTPVPMATNPQSVWDTMFSTAGSAQLDRERQKAIWSTVQKQYDRWGKKLGKTDQQKMNAHLGKLTELKTSAEAAGAACTPQMRPGGFDIANSNSIPGVAKAMIDLGVMSLACDLTRVVTLQMTDSESKNNFPWLNLNDNHHGYQHDRGYQPDQLTVIYNWYAQQFAYLLEELSKVKEGDQSLLDSTAILWITELSHPPAHSQDNMPWVLAGKAGGALRTGQWARFNNPPHNNLLVTLQNAYGITGNTFGLPQYCSGPLTGLLA